MTKRCSMLVWICVMLTVAATSVKSHWRAVPYASSDEPRAEPSQENQPFQPVNRSDSKESTPVVKSNCVRCHLTAGRELTVPVHDFARSVHDRVKMSCNDCHGGNIEDDTTAHEQEHGFIGTKLSAHMAACSDCHTEEAEVFSKGAHFWDLTKRINRDYPVCIDCHGNHDVGKPPAEFSLMNVCSDCHKKFADDNPDLLAVVAENDKLWKTLRKVHAKNRDSADPTPREFRRDLAAMRYSTARLIHAAGRPSTEQTESLNRRVATFREHLETWLKEHEQIQSKGVKSSPPTGILLMLGILESSKMKVSNMDARSRGFGRRRFLKTACALVFGPGFQPTHVFSRELGEFIVPQAAVGSASADVGIARGSNMEDAVRRAVRLAGGMDFIQEGQTVLIKPNVTGVAQNPTTTNPEVLYATIKLVAEHGPRRIIVADRSFSSKFDVSTPKTVDVMQRVGHIDAVNQAISDAKAPVVAVGLEDAAAEFERLGRPADTEHWRRIKLPTATHWQDGFELAELLFAVDHVINVPVIKTHFQAWFTMSMKSFVGMSHHRSRREFHSTWTGEGNLFDQKRTSSRRRGIKKDPEEEAKEIAPFVNRIAELNLGITPALNILDGTESFVFGGPSSGDTAQGKLIVASRDRIAADATGIAVLKWLGTEERLQNRSVWANPFIKHGIKIGLGIDSVEKVHLKHEGLDGEIDKIHAMLA